MVLSCLPKYFEAVKRHFKEFIYAPEKCYNLSQNMRHTEFEDFLTHSRLIPTWISWVHLAHPILINENSKSLNCKQINDSLKKLFISFN